MTEDTVNDSSYISTLQLSTLQGYHYILGTAVAQLEDTLQIKRAIREPDVFTIEQSRSSLFLQSW